MSSGVVSGMVIALLAFLFSVSDFLQRSGGLRGEWWYGAFMYVIALPFALVFYVFPASILLVVVTKLLDGSWKKTSELFLSVAMAPVAYLATVVAVDVVLAIIYLGVAMWWK